MAITKLRSKVERSIETPRTTYVVGLDPAGFVRIREKRVRRSYGISVEALFYLLVTDAAADQRRYAGAYRKRKRGLK